MSTASAVPETTGSAGRDDPKETLRGAGLRSLARDTVERFVAADGFSHTRALGHATVMAGVPGLLAIVGLAGVLDLGLLQKVLEQALKGMAPGSSSRLLTSTFDRGNGKGPVMLGAGLVGVLTAGTFAMAQVERGCNRVYGLETDRPLRHKLTTAFSLSVTGGLMLGLAFLSVAAGGAVGDALQRELGWGSGAAFAFGVFRWVVGIALTFGGLTLLYLRAPNRRQPGARWLQTGTVIATLSWFLMTGLLAAYYAINERVAESYGPLLGVVAVLSWAYATALALFLGIAFAAQLEAVRAGVPGPRR